VPDRAVVGVVVEGEGRSRAEAYDLAAARAAAVDEVLARHAGGVDRAVTTAVVVQPTTRWHKGESVRTGWTASRTTSVEVVDLSQLGDIVAELATDGSTISGPTWQLDPTNPVHTDARRLAAEDARRRADGYAAALGLRVTGVAWVAEPELRSPAPQPFRMAMAAPMAADAGPEAVIAIVPDEMLVEAEVDVGFDFEPIAR
jgi:uncharacterized protein YggE